MSPYDYKTDNGFYVGDRVEFEDKATFIEEIVSRGHWAWTGSMRVPATVVRLRDGRLALDTRLTRIE